MKATQLDTCQQDDFKDGIEHFFFRTEKANITNKFTSQSYKNDMIILRMRRFKLYCACAQQQGPYLLFIVQYHASITG